MSHGFCKSRVEAHAPLQPRGTVAVHFCLHKNHVRRVSFYLFLRRKIHNHNHAREQKPTREVQVLQLLQEECWEEPAVKQTVGSESQLEEPTGFREQSRKNYVLLINQTPAKRAAKREERPTNNLDVLSGSANVLRSRLTNIHGA